MKYLVDVYHHSLNKVGEELCGDQIRVLSTGGKTRMVLCDGLGSGVKANILATLSSEIIINMLRYEIPLTEVIETVVASLPVDKRHNLSYTTKTVIEIDNTDLSFKIFNFDNPPILYYHDGKFTPLEFSNISILDKNVLFCRGTLHRGDLLIAMSDGIVHAGIGGAFNFEWNLEHITDYIQELLQVLPSNVRLIVEKVTAHTNELYGRKPSDDASLAGLLVRAKQHVMLLTGPPLDPAEDRAIAQRILEFQGTRIVCGGTTGKIVAAHSGQSVSVKPETARMEVPPMGSLPGIDLLTEGILTLTSVLEWIEATGGNANLLPKRDKSGAIQVADILLDADEITLLVGLKINPAYQNPDLPQSVSIRRNLMERIAECLTRLGKSVQLEFH